LGKFVELFEGDIEMNGGLKDENIAKKEKRVGANVQLLVELTFRSNRVKPRKVRASVKKEANGYRLCDSGLLPLDMKNL